MEETDHADETQSRGNRVPKIVVTSVALAVLASVIVLDVDVKAGLLVLMLIAVLPWLAVVVEQIEFAGVASLRLRKVQVRVEEQELELRRQSEIIEQLVVYSMSWFLPRPPGGARRPDHRGPPAMLRHAHRPVSSRPAISASRSAAPVVPRRRKIVRAARKLCRVPAPRGFAVRCPL